MKPSKSYTRTLARIKKAFGPNAQLIKTDGGYMVRTADRYLTAHPTSLEAIKLGLRLAGALEKDRLSNKQLDAPICSWSKMQSLQSNRGTGK